MIQDATEKPKKNHVITRIFLRLLISFPVLIVCVVGFVGKSVLLSASEW